MQLTTMLVYINVNSNVYILTNAMTTKVISFRLTNQQLVALRNYTNNHYQSDSEAAKTLLLEIIADLVKPEPSNIEVKLKELQAQIDSLKLHTRNQMEAIAYDATEALDNSRQALDSLGISKSTGHY